MKSFFYKLGTCILGIETGALPGPLRLLRQDGGHQKIAGTLNEPPGRPKRQTIPKM